MSRHLLADSLSKVLSYVRLGRAGLPLSDWRPPYLPQIASNSSTLANLISVAPGKT
jgi:hypothetical protein